MAFTGCHPGPLNKALGLQLKEGRSLMTYDFYLSTFLLTH